MIFFYSKTWRNKFIIIDSGNYLQCGNRGNFSSKYKGFTLIELLAIIVILAIIAVITVPVILNIIDSAKEGAAKVSATGYIKAVDNQLMVNGMDTNPDNDIRSDGTVTVESLGTTYGVTVNGEKPLNKSTVTFTNGEVTGYRLYISGYIITMTSGVVTVTKDYVQVDSISAPSTLNVTVGETANIAVTFNPTDATNKSLVFTSSNESIATVDSNGVVTGHTVNETVTITATSVDNSSATATINVTVNPAPIPVTGVDITESNLVLLFGEKRQFHATVIPDSATNGNIRWSSGNSTVITVDENTGLVTAVGEGTTTLTASSVMDNTKTDTISVTVSPSSTVCVLDSTNPNTGYTNTLTVNSVSYLTGDKYRCKPWTTKPANQEEEYFNFYVLDANDSTDTISLLMDRNISGTSAMNWATATNYLKTNNYSNQTQSNAIWNRVDSVTLPTAQQIAVAGKVYDLANWNIGSSYSYYGASSSKDDSSNRSNYAWLYDYTNSCKTNNYGCNYETTSGAYGYWTATEKTGESNPAAWVSRGIGTLYGLWASYSGDYGVRPVIILGASKLSQ